MKDAAARDGLMLVAKPAGVTSHDVVERIRRSSPGKGRRVGHTGTLDPFATGLLLILVGRATRIQRYLTALPKSYRTRARFGATSDTGDPTGTLTHTGKSTTEAGVRAVLPRLTGELRQRVPRLSAVKVGGERLYRKARRGELVETPVRDVEITRLDLLSFDEHEQLAELEIECSSGTYVRQLVADLGDFCETGAYCETLERLAIGPFTLDRADEKRLIGFSDALGFMPERVLTPEEAGRASHGSSIENRGQAAHAGALIRLTIEGELIAIAECREGALKPVTVLSR
jgi:tRNA pseudouridine55 synthase